MVKCESVCIILTEQHVNSDNDIMFSKWNYIGVYGHKKKLKRKNLRKAILKSSEPLRYLLILQAIINIMCRISVLGTPSTRQPRH